MDKSFSLSEDDNSACGGLCDDRAIKIKIGPFLCNLQAGLSWLGDSGQATSFSWYTNETTSGLGKV